MKDNSLYKLGGVCAILMGIINILGDITYILLPADQRLGVPAGTILPAISKGAPLLKAQLLELAFLGILGLIVVPAFSELFRLAGIIQIIIEQFIPVDIGYLIEVFVKPFDADIAVFIQIIFETGHPMPGQLHSGGNRFSVKGFGQIICSG